MGSGCVGGCSNESNKCIQEEREPKEGDEKEFYRTVVVGQVQGPGAAVVMVGPQHGPSSPQGSCGEWGVVFLYSLWITQAQTHRKCKPV